MAPKRGESIERTEEHETFIEKLREYHEKRGTNLDPEPRVGIRHIDLYKLYERVVEEGGYDLVSDTKAKPLMWRKLAEEFVGKNQYTTAQAFQIKNVYYKNLCAYEISDHWGKEPPPKEILEDVTAKGGNVMTRTLENFARSNTREADGLQNGEMSDEGPEHKTPKEEKVDLFEDPGSANGRTRSLRQQPPQRVLFQPDVGSSRPSRGQHQQPQHMGLPNGSSTFNAGMGPNGNYNSAASNAASATLASYEPPQSYPLSLKPVVTPANNPEFYRQERKRKAEANAGPLAKKYRNIMLPGTGFIGPNIYVRAQLALQSGIPDEEQYALHHLVKISHERGDKYRFDQFPGLAEALAKKALHVSSLFYDVDWEISYDGNVDQDEDDVLDGLNGTLDIAQKLQGRMPLIMNDNLQDPEFLSQIGRITEASLVIRNMCLQVENAQYLARQPMMRDYFAIILNMPAHPSVTELRYHVLDTAEQVLIWCHIDSESTIYESLLKLPWSSDRGTIIAALKIIARLGMNIPMPKKLERVSPKLLQKVQEWLMVEDEELRSACLDFLFQYTSFSDNVRELMSAVDAPALARQLSRLLLFAAKEERRSRGAEAARAEHMAVPVPRLSRSLIENLLKLDEPERSSEWLRMCFLPDPNSEMTQISLWQAYQGTFGPFHGTHPHLIAGDFIKNVSSTFTGATAQVAGANKYVIKGIKARRVPVDTGALSGSKSADRGRELHRCCWAVTVTTEATTDPLTGISNKAVSKEVECSEWFKHGDDILRHILRDHLRVPQKAAKSDPPVADPSTDSMDLDVTPGSTPSTLVHNNKSPLPSNSGFDFSAADQMEFHCRWGRCGRRASEFGGQSHKVSRTVLFARHIQTHLPESQTSSVLHNIKPDSQTIPLTGERVTYTTLTDERGEPAGVALGAALVLRNIAKFLPVDASTGKQSENKELHRRKGREDGRTNLMTQVFDEEVMERLFFAVAHSRNMQHAIGLILQCVAQYLRDEETRSRATEVVESTTSG